MSVLGIFVRYTYGGVFMKKILVFIISFIFIISAFCVYTFAGDSVSSLFENSLSEADLEFLSDKENYREDAKDVDTEGTPVLKIYCALYWNLFDNGIDETLEYAEEQNAAAYVVWGEEPVRLTVLNHDGKKAITKLKGEWHREYIREIAEMGTSTEILGQKCTVTDIYCFEDYHTGAAVYFITDHGVFIRYYDFLYADKYNEGIWFTEADFCEYAEGYYKFRTSYFNNYSFFFVPKGGTASFFDYIEEWHDSPQREFVSMSVTTVHVIGAAFLAVFIAAIVIIVIFARKIKKKDGENRG